MIAVAEADIPSISTIEVIAWGVQHFTAPVVIIAQEEPSPEEIAVAEADTPSISTGEIRPPQHFTAPVVRIAQLL